MIRVHKELEKLLNGAAKETNISRVKVSRLLADSIDINTLKNKAKRIKRRKKRGQIADLAVFLGTLFIIAALVTTTWFVSSNIVDSFKAGGFNNTAEANNVIEGITDVGQAGNAIFGIVLVGLTLALLLSAILIPTNIVFMIIYFIGYIFIWITSVIVSNAYSALTATGTLADAASSLTVVDTVMNNLPIYFTFLGMIIILIMFGKGRLLQ